MRCVICNGEEWQNVDEYRQVKVGMSMCVGCGFISYPEKYTNKAAVLEHYRTTYRQAPTADNVYTGTRKLHYHAAFLEELIAKWTKEEKKDPVISDVGAAFGMFLHWWKQLRHPKTGAQLFPSADLNGVELTLSFRRNAYHEFGLDLKEEFDESKKYDLITSYKVAEHIYDIDEEFKKYYDCLKDDGLFYVSVPTWFNILHNFGCESSYDIEYYYHPDHCNVWERNHFERLLMQSGFAIIKKDFAAYDATYLCRKLKDGEEVEDVKCLTPNQIKENLIAIKEATDLFNKNEFAKAIEAYGNFPMAWRGFYEYGRAAFHKKGFPWIEENIIKKVMEIDEDNLEFYYLAADLYMRYAKYNDALGIIKKALDKRAKCSSLLANIGNCYRALAKECQDPKQKVELLNQARTITRYMKDNHPNAFAQCTTWIYNDNAQIPMPSELEG